MVKRHHAPSRTRKLCTDGIDQGFGAFDSVENGVAVDRGLVGFLISDQDNAATRAAFSEAFRKQLTHRLRQRIAEQHQSKPCRLDANVCFFWIKRGEHVEPNAPQDSVPKRYEFCVGSDRKNGLLRWHPQSLSHSTPLLMIRLVGLGTSCVWGRSQRIVGLIAAVIHPNYRYSHFHRATPVCTRG